MGEFAYFIAKQVLGRLARYGGSYASQEVRLAWGARDELKKLERTLSSITTVLLDAEEKQMKRRGLTEWLVRLKDVCYDIEDVLDEFAYNVLFKTSEGEVRYFFSSQFPLWFDLKMGHKLKEIREKLDEIDKNKSQFSLVERDGGQWLGLHDMHTTNGRETHSAVPSYVIPRHDDQEEIIKYLFNNDASSSDENVSVISIIGLGGLGKTTLATLVYNDNMVVEKFENRFWVYVSNHFNSKRLIREILSQNGEKCEESLEVMQKKLQNALRGKKILLVLDDVWDERPIGLNSTKWDEFTTLLSFGIDKGSKIILTTRNESVGLLVNSIHMHFLEGLSDEDCMSLFIKKAFKSGVNPHQDYPELMKIGEGIVNKCGGVPLAVAAIGSVLHLKTDPVEWILVRDDDIWLSGNYGNVVLPALKLSYDALPHHLRPCFAFCSLFPKDHLFRGSELIPLWMAQGYLKCSHKNEDFETIGLQYITQFCSRSLFQVEADSIFQIKFKVHDLVHDLAISVAQTEYCSINHRPPSNASEMVRHVSFSDEDISAASMPSHLPEMEKVRTILFSVSWEWETINPSFVKTCISRFKYSRALDLSNTSVKELPSSIGNLIHLRYLNLSRTNICSLPNSICKLLNLQYLNLLWCWSLEKLPIDIGNLINLRYLGVTTKEEYLPNGIGRLSLLQHLIFQNCLHLKSLGEEIQCLTNLRKLYIYNCPQIKSLPPNTEKLTSLGELVIWTCEKVDLMKSGDGIRGLRSFKIGFIPCPSMSVLPHWLENSAHTLQSLNIRHCENLEVLPDWLHKSKSLQRLKIYYCPQLSALPDGLLHQLTALRHLVINYCHPALTKELKKQLKGSQVARHGKIILDEDPYTDDEGADGGDIYETETSGDEGSDGGDII